MPTTATFPDALRGWRQTRRLSQMELASEAGVSARHLSYLETGRSHPSRRMVLRLSRALDVPRAERNTLLTHAGYAPLYPALPLDDDQMAAVSDAMSWTIERHDPYPGLVMDAVWTIVALNPSAERLFGLIGATVGSSLLEVAGPGSAASEMIENWGEVGFHTMQRLRLESARAGGVAELDDAAARFAADDAVAGYVPPERPHAVVPTIFAAGDLRLSLFSTFATFGTAEEVTLSEMQIELMFPADHPSRELLHALAAAVGV